MNIFVFLLKTPILISMFFFAKNRISLNNYNLLNATKIITNNEKNLLLLEEMMMYDL